MGNPRLEDGNGGTDTAAVRITVTPVNDAPTIGDAVRAAPFEDDAPITIDLLEGTVDVDGDTLNISDLFLIAGDDSGVTVNGNTLEIDPSAYNALQAGALETLRYRYDILDGNGAEVRQVAIINIQGLNDAPTALNDLFTTAEDNAVSGDVLADNGVNPDRDPDGDTLTVSATPVTDVANGTLVLDTDGTFTYTPDADFNGVDRFVYTLDDGNGGTDTPAVRITVTAVNDAPVAADDAISGDEDTDITGDVLADNGSGSDSDVDGDTLTVSATLVTNVVNGALTLNTDGTFTYTPDANFNGSDSFEYTLDDGNGGTDTAIVTLTVNPVNDAPVALNDLFAVNRAGFARHDQMPE
jgi:hypothetical protein